MLFATEAKYPDLHDEVILLFQEVQMEMVHCSLCGDYHPPEIHLAPTTPADAVDPEEA